MAINIVGDSGKFFSSLGKIVVCPENFFDSQNGTLTENFLATAGWGGGGDVAEKNFEVKKFLRPPTQNMPKGPVFLRYATGVMCYVSCEDTNQLSYYMVPHKIITIL